MKVIYEGKVPQIMMFKGFSGLVKKGDELEMDEQTFKELANLKLKKVSGSKSSKKTEETKEDKDNG